MSKVMSDVYLRAAELVDGDIKTFSCSAVYAANGYTNHSLDDAYAEIFRPKERPNSGKWDTWGSLWDADANKRKQCRVVALLFMHWMTQKDKPKRRKAK